MRSSTHATTVLPWLVIAVLAAACSGAADGDGARGTGQDGGQALSGEITILHAFTAEADVQALEAVTEAFEARHPNVTVTEEGSNDFGQLARARIASGTPPDIILHPQPGLLRDFIAQGVVQPLDRPTPAREQDARVDLVAEVVDLTTVDGVPYAFPVRVSIKSLVWYDLPVFESAGYEVPSTWDDLLALTEQIAEDGRHAPWCIGIESGEATGWPATDWVEDVVLRALGPERYDAWVAGELAFASPEVLDAVEQHMVPIWTTDGYVAGGREAIARTDFGQSVAGILGGSDARCVLHRQATFIEGFIAEADPDATFGTDYGVFVLPPIDPDHGTPVLGAADLAARYTDTPASRAFMDFITTREAGEGWARGGFLSPLADVDPTAYPTDSAREAARILGEADVFRFDGSDLMPGDVGASSRPGSFWLEMTRWIAGDATLEEAFAAIDRRYAEVAGG